MAPPAVCPHCHAGELEEAEATGQTVCTNCGAVLEESNIVSSVEFMETAAGTSSVIGQFVSATATKPYGVTGPGYGLSRESREVAIENGRRYIQTVAAQLHLSPHFVDSAHRLYILAVHNHFTQGRRTAHVVAACLYIVCRREKSAHLLIDFAEALQANVYTLGACFLKFTRMLSMNLPIVDPSLFIHRFAARLELGDQTHAVAMTALRLVARMRRDWIQTGRRPAGICGACLLIAARMHGFKRTRPEIMQVVRITDITLRNRLAEFDNTAAAQLTPDEFDLLENLPEADPPSYIRGILEEEFAKEAALLEDAYQYDMAGGAGADTGSGASGGNATSSLALALVDTRSDAGATSMVIQTSAGEVTEARARAIVDRPGIASLLDRNNIMGLFTGGRGEDEASGDDAVLTGLNGLTMKQVRLLKAKALMSKNWGSALGKLQRELRRGTAGGSGRGVSPGTVSAAALRDDDGASSGVLVMDEEEGQEDEDEDEEAPVTRGRGSKGQGTGRASASSATGKASGKGASSNAGRMGDALHSLLAASAATAAEQTQTHRRSSRTSRESAASTSAPSSSAPAGGPPASLFPRRSGRSGLRSASAGYADVSEGEEDPEAVVATQQGETESDEGDSDDGFVRRSKRHSSSARGSTSRISATSISSAPRVGKRSRKSGLAHDAADDSQSTCALDEGASTTASSRSRGVGAPSDRLAASRAMYSQLAQDMAGEMEDGGGAGAGATSSHTQASAGASGRSMAAALAARAVQDVASLLAKQAAAHATSAAGAGADVGAVLSTGLGLTAPLNAEQQGDTNLTLTQALARLPPLPPLPPVPFSSLGASQAAGESDAGASQASMPAAARALLARNRSSRDAPAYAHYEVGGAITADAATLFAANRDFTAPEDLSDDRDREKHAGTLESRSGQRRGRARSASGTGSAVSGQWEEERGRERDDTGSVALSERSRSRSRSRPRASSVGADSAGAGMGAGGLLASVPETGGPPPNPVPGPLTVFDDIPDDDVDVYLLESGEAEKRSAMWSAIHGGYVKERADKARAKAEKRARDGAAGEGDDDRSVSARSTASSSGGGTGGGGRSVDRSRSSMPGRSAKDGARNLLSTGRLSKKLNADAVASLDRLFGDDKDKEKDKGDKDKEDTGTGAGAGAGVGGGGGKRARKGSVGKQVEVEVEAPAPTPHVAPSHAVPSAGKGKGRKRGASTAEDKEGLEVVAAPIDAPVAKRAKDASGAAKAVTVPVKAPSVAAPAPVDAASKPQATAEKVNKAAPAPAPSSSGAAAFAAQAKPVGIIKPGAALGRAAGVPIAVPLGLGRGKGKVAPIIFEEEEEEFVAESRWGGALKKGGAGDEGEDNGGDNE